MCGGAEPLARFSEWTRSENYFHFHWANPTARGMWAKVNTVLVTLSPGKNWTNRWAGVAGHSGGAGNGQTFPSDQPDGLVFSGSIYTARGRQAPGGARASYRPMGPALWVWNFLHMTSFHSCNNTTRSVGLLISEMSI